MTPRNDDRTKDHELHMREVRISVSRILSEFLQQASEPGFAGNLKIEIPTKDGRVGRIKKIIETFV